MNSFTVVLSDRLLNPQSEPRTERVNGEKCKLRIVRNNRRTFYISFMLGKIVWETSKGSMIVRRNLTRIIGGLLNGTKQRRGVSEKSLVGHNKEFTFIPV